MMSKKRSAEKNVRDIRRATRRHYFAEEKIRIVLEGLRSEDGIAALMRFELDWPDNCREYRSGIEVHEAVITELDDYAPGMQHWLESKGV